MGRDILKDVISRIQIAKSKAKERDAIEIAAATKFRAKVMAKIAQRKALVNNDDIRKQKEKTDAVTALEATCASKLQKEVQKTTLKRIQTVNSNANEKLAKEVVDSELERNAVNTTVETSADVEAQFETQRDILKDVISRIQIAKS